MMHGTKCSCDGEQLKKFMAQFKRNFKVAMLAMDILHFVPGLGCLLWQVDKTYLDKNISNLWCFVE